MAKESILDNPFTDEMASVTIVPFPHLKGSNFND